jgi:hypothetical protein
MGHASNRLGQETVRQASINWAAINKNLHSILLVELKNGEDREALVKLRTELQNISRAQNVGVIFGENRFQFVLAVDSREGAVLEQAKSEIKRKMQNAEVIFIHKTPQELKAEYPSRE